MAEEREITTVFRADISQFSAATQQLNRNVAQVNAEFKNATASMGRWNDNTDGLKAKLTQLNGVLDNEKKRLGMLEAQYAELQRQGKGNTAEAQKLATAIQNQSAKVKETEKNIKFYTESLEELEDAGVNTRDELDKLNKKLDEQKQAAKDLGGGIMKGAALGVAGFAAACAGAFGAANNLVNEYKELNTQMGMLETSFKEANLGVEASEKTYGELFSVLGDSGKATEASLHLAQVAKNEKELMEYTNILTGVYAKFGDSLPVESMAEAINVSSTLGEISGTLVDAFEFSGQSIDKHNEALANLTTEEERNAYIKEELNKIYKDTGEAYKETNKDVIAANAAQNEYNQTMAKLATEVQPYVTQFKTVMVGALAQIMPQLISGMTWVSNNLNWLLPVLGSVIGLVGAISAGIKIYNGVMAIARTVQLAWNLALSANPIGLVVIAIAGLVAAFVTLWNKCEGFRNFFINMWEAIKKVGSAAAEFIGKIFETKINLVKGIINTVISLINGAIRAINKISVKVPDWVPEFGGRSFGFNLPTIPKLAQGGIVDRPTLAMIGEAGKEAVMPLENNTAWIDKLADKLSGKMQASNVTYTINNRFEKMETSRLALHQANLETKRLLKGGI